jgi:hypothetical protein
MQFCYIQRKVRSLHVGAYLNKIGTIAVVHRVVRNSCIEFQWTCLIGVGERNLLNVLK